MSLGEKLRQARLDAGLSQRALCGEEITRNMLSQIEHGTAKPSMSTLQYLAKQLSLPVSYFLEEDTEVSSNRKSMDAAWDAFLSGDSVAALDALERYLAPDPIYDREYTILRSYVLLAQAEMCLNQGREVYARKLLAQVEQLEASVPWLREIRQRRLLLLSKLEPVGQEELDSLDPLLLLHAQSALAAGRADRAVSLLEASFDKDAPQWSLLRGKAALLQKEYASAARYLQQADSAYPQETAPLLEQAFRELGDYKAAYYYACKQR